jgi:hypothetical protein
MQIPKNLPQFKNNAVLLLVTGRQDAVLYRACDGTIKRLDSFKIPNPHYSDHEGSATTGELVDTKSIIRDFFRELKRRIKKTPEFSKLFIFAPAQTKNKIGSVLPLDWQNKIESIFPGNFYSSHPLDLLKKLSLAAS